MKVQVMTHPVQSVSTSEESRTSANGRVVDVLIVGGGSAGAVLASRLSEDSDRKVRLLEAGHGYAPDHYPAVIANSDILGANGDPAHEWGYKSEPGHIGHAIQAIRGKVLGGSSGVNGAVALRARREDFERWDMPDWRYEDLLPFFKKLESRVGGDEALHGRNGPLPVHQLTRSDITPMQEAFVVATLAQGFKEISDFDGADANGVGAYPMNIVKGVRVNTGMSYLSSDVRARSNLRISTDCLVDVVLFEGKRAVGVRLATGESLFASEAILCAGTYGSAAILLRSGVGPAEHMRDLGIGLIADLPVGLNLVDHPFYYNAYAAKPDRIGAQSPVIGAKLWTHSTAAVPGELDLHITATHLFPHDQSPTKLGFVLAVALTRPVSRGQLWLSTRNPSDAPKIDLNFLADPLDETRLLEGVKLARRIGQTAPFAEMVHSELNPGPAAQSDAAILASIKATLDTYHHPTSTAPMGVAGSAHAVVDFQTRVHGLEGLRVVDASIFPDAPSVATNVTTIAFAELAASRYGQSLTASAKGHIP